MKEKLSKILNYIYFRLAKVYYKWDDEEADTATHGVSVVMFSVVFNVALLIRVILFKFNPIKVDKI